MNPESFFSYKDLSKAEIQLCKAFRGGELVDLRTGDHEQDDPHRSSEWGEQRQVRGGLLAALLLSDAKPYSGQVSAIRLIGAHVVGSLNLSHAKVEYPLLLQQCKFMNSVNMEGATTRSVTLWGSALHDLEADGATIEGHLRLDRCSSEKIKLSNARITGSLCLNEARLANCGGVALDADLIVVEQGMYCRRGFHALGEVRLMSGSITGTLSFTDARMINPGENALSADLMVVKGAMFCQGLVAKGEIRLLSAHIASQLIFDGAKLLNPGKDALSAQGLIVEGGMHCGNKFHVEGKTNLTGARIAHRLDFNEAFLENPGKIALQCQNIETEELWLQKEFSAAGKVCLSNAQFGTIHDNPDNLLDLDLNGMQYKDLDPTLPSSERLKWLRRGEERYRPQPYEQLAAYYRRQGDDVEARRTLQAKQLSRRAERPWYIRCIEYPLVLVGYGYRPMLAALWMLLLLIACSVLFEFWRPVPINSTSSPYYNPMVYAIDLLLPIINFGHENAFTFKGIGQLFPVLIVLFGWILTTAVVAGVARVLTRS